ncbi:phosphotransferase [Actinokineospora guangxiensis]|uniref:Phosphotransferase n=1 Tax=Actinokineospora guangxiensis TaxID=1490288 RepID=A0ABW0EUL0_9PSEU
MPTESRTARAVAAASAAARDLGVEHDDPQVLYDVFSVVVHLAPSPVVVRVPTVLPPGNRLAEQVERQRAELAVTSWLAGTGFPAVAPSPLVPTEPVVRDGLSMTFWQWVETLDIEHDYPARMAKTAHLHAALLDYPGELPFMLSLDGSLDASLDVLAERPDLLPAEDVARARAEWAALRPVVTDRDRFAEAHPGVPVQVVHGDAPAWNLLDTTSGQLFADFELVVTGPVEWDLAMMPPEVVASYDATAAELGLRTTDPDVLALVNAVGMLRGVACMALVPELPSLAEDLAPMLEHWRSTPVVG